MKSQVYAVEFTCVNELQDIPQPTAHDLCSVHPGRLHLPSVTLPTIPKQTEQLLLCQRAKSAEAKPLRTIPVDHRQLRPSGSAYPGLHQFTPPTKHYQALSIPRARMSTHTIHSSGSSSGDVRKIARIVTMYHCASDALAKL